MSLSRYHHKVESNILVLILMIFITVIVGGIVEIIPLFSIESTIETVQGLRPYSPLELAGRNIYIREGCYNCHSQMIRPFRDETERYGHYSLAAESKYDHPFQWGSKRTGPDLARVGGKYANDWHLRHLTNPRSVVPDSIMPGYPHLAARPLDIPNTADHLKTLRLVGVPYSDEQIANANTDLSDQADPNADHTSLLARYPKSVVGTFDGNPNMLSEADAIIAYLQMLGTLVDFTDFDPRTTNAVR